jgi:hypothetical protein
VSVTIAFLTADELAAIKRPHVAEFYRILLAKLHLQAKAWGVSSDDIATYVWQSPGHTGTYNAYRFRHDGKTACYSGHHVSIVVAAGEYNENNLRGPISRGTLMEWWSNCPDFRDPTIFRPKRLA